MRFSLWALTALILGALATHFLLQDRGYVLIEFRGYLLQMSVPGLIVLLLLLYAGVRVLLAVWRAPRALGEQLAEHRARRATQRLTQGVMQLAEGRWSKAEKLLAGGARRNEAALLNYLMAARAAQLQGARERRDRWLQKALEERPDAAATVLLTRAELQFEAGEFDSARATLRHLMETEPDNTVAVGLLARTYAELADWRAVLELLPRLKDTNLEPAVLERLAGEALERFGRHSDITHEAFETTWSGLPPLLRRAPALLRVRAQVLQRLGHADQAEGELRGLLRKTWHAELVATYGEVVCSDPREQLRRAEKWLDQHADDPALLLAAARLCIANELWGKARSYLESSLAIAPRPESYALFAGLLEKLGEPESAAEAWRSGLGLVTGRSALPAPAVELPSPDAQDLSPRAGD